ncbi:hypothetical protein QFC20_000712 [Naganishia adeliensis]|uniref:Uncharacterized protein n=1 Tax=Naganishia adeliensis TaxID=92952 RepID=A0ACC2WZT2_9TREE|nr:hypothetical protein QFC20_000712 [Naganishia adeliensis]
MGLLSSSNPAKKALKDLARTEKDEHRAQKVRHAALLVILRKAYIMCKARDKTIRRHAKAERKEDKMAEKMNRVAFKHETALSREKKLAQDIQVREQLRTRLEQDIATKRQAFERVTQRHYVTDIERTERRQDLDTHAIPPYAPEATHVGAVHGESWMTTAAGSSAEPPRYIAAKPATEKD